MTFEDWFNEIEGYALRGERFYDDLEFFRGDNPQIILRWLKSAYEAGHEHALNSHLDDGK